jgi:hypothetical protein
VKFGEHGPYRSTRSFSKSRLSCDLGYTHPDSQHSLRHKTTAGVGGGLN